MVARPNSPAERARRGAASLIDRPSVLQRKERALTVWKGP
jgi:hypothetical protein